MPSPQVSFRLSEYQLARGLKIIRTIEPNATPSSLSQLVKTLYIDYMAKTSLANGAEVTPEDIAEIQCLAQSKVPSMGLTDFQTAISNQPSVTEPTAIESTQEAINILAKSVPALKPSEKSEISSVSDFSPPADWTK